MSILRVRDENGNIIEIPALKGDKGENGKDGKDAIVDQTYNPESENAQSGKAVDQALEPYKYLQKDEDDFTTIPNARMNSAVVSGNITNDEPPRYSSHLANKAYVDAQIGSIETALDSIIAIQNELIGDSVV